MTAILLSMVEKGQHRDNPPNVYVYRSSIWEDYINDANATAKAYVDGIGTITPVISHNFYDPIYGKLVI